MAEKGLAITARDVWKGGNDWAGFQNPTRVFDEARLVVMLSSTPPEQFLRMKRGKRNLIRRIRGNIHISPRDGKFNTPAEKLESLSCNATGRYSVRPFANALLRLFLRRLGRRILARRLLPLLHPLLLLCVALLHLLGLLLVALFDLLPSCFIAILLR